MNAFIEVKRKEWLIISVLLETWVKAKRQALPGWGDKNISPVIV